MKEIITEYIKRSEELLLANPTDYSIKAFSQKIKSIKNLPENYLSSFDEAIPSIYEDLKDLQSEQQKQMLIITFALMINSVKTAIKCDKLQIKHPDFDVHVLNKELLETVIKTHGITTDEL